MRIVFHPKAEREFSALPVGERIAMGHAIEKRASSAINSERRIVPR